MGGWLDICTAPTGRAGYGRMHRILATDGETVSTAYWSGYDWRCEAEATTEYDIAVHDTWKPTHWMPLPTPPASQPKPEPLDTPSS